MAKREKKKRSKKQEILTLLSIELILVIIIMILLFYRLFESESPDSSLMNVSATEPAQTAFPTPTPTPGVQIDLLRSELQNEIDTFDDGDWAVYVKDLDSGESFAINDTQMIAASLIKLFTAGTYYEQIAEGNLQDNEYNQSLLELMISQSDNDAWVALETVIGGGSYETGVVMVTDFCQAQGYTNSGRLLNISTGEWNYWDGENMTSVSDVGSVLEKIYNGTYVSAECSETILRYMLEQADWHRNKIPAGVPENIITANKTGELDSVQNDAAIVYGSKCTYIMVVMSENDAQGDVDIARIAQMSSEVYQYLNPDETTVSVSTDQPD